jgi:hypothetical protein
VVLNVDGQEFAQSLRVEADPSAAGPGTRAEDEDDE